MKTTITIYGASDDLIEIEGDITEEFSPANEEKPTYLAFSDGTVLSVYYGKDGFWRIHRAQIGTCSCEKKEGTDADNDYSDRVTLSGDLRWIVCGGEMTKAA